MKTALVKMWARSLLGGLLTLATAASAGWLFQGGLGPNGVADPMGNHLVDGIVGPNFSLVAMEGHIITGEGGSVYTWSFADGNGTIGFQYPAPTLIVNQGDIVNVTLTNTLPFPVSIVFPGQLVTSATGGTAGLLTQEAVPGTVATPSAAVTYTFTASLPGTYTYNSGTRQDLQIEMGMVGALIVRPTGFVNATKTTWKAYNTTDSGFDQEFLFLLSDMDPNIHDAVEHLREAYTGVGVFNPVVDTTNRDANYWFINGRTAPDDMMIAFSKSLPAQPYDGTPMMHPTQRMLMRMVGGGRDGHPFHHHLNHARNIARNGRPLQSSPAATISDLSYLTFTIPTYPGETTDAIFTYTGEGLGWDMYGHTGTDPLAYGEDPNDHLKPFPVMLPNEADMDFGAWYGGSPFLGTAAPLPPNLGGFDPAGAFVTLWHSHNEREIVNHNVFPGGMFTMLFIVPWSN